MMFLMVFLGCANPVNGTWSVGEFSVVMDSGTHLVVTHPEIEAPVFESFEMDWISVADGTVEAVENQGSYTLTQTAKAYCELAVFDDVSVEDARLSFRGAFEDEVGLCADLNVTLDFESVAVGQLHMSLDTDGADKDQITVRLRRDEAERWMGMGEQFVHEDLDLSGRQIVALVQEGGVGRGDPDITPIVEAGSPGSGGSEGSSYAPMPYLVSSHGRSLLLDNTEVSVFDLQQDQSLSVQLHSDTFDAQWFVGEQPLDVIQRLTAWTGRMPALPDWVGQGAIVALARPLDESGDIVTDLLAADAAIGAVWNQTWSGSQISWVGEQVLWNWVLDVEKEETWPDWQEQLNAQGVRTLCYINPMLVDVGDTDPSPRRNLFAEASSAGHLVKDVNGQDLLIPVTAFEVGLIDLTSTSARDWMKAVIADEVINGANCSGWMADFGEALPFDAVLHSGVSAAQYHNQYPVDWAGLNREVVEEADLLGEALVFSRSGFTGISGAAIAMWEGDQLTNWGAEDGLVSALHGLLSGGFSGLSINHSDIGGYTSLSLFGLQRDAELLARWSELAAFTPIFRTHEGNQPDENVQVYSNDATMTHFSRMSRVFRAASVVREPLLTQATDFGWPVVRHMAMHYPDDEAAWATHDQFLLGPDVLVAPVLHPCDESDDCDVREDIYLPEGLWAHLWSGAEYDCDSLGMKVSVQAPLGQPPVFVRVESAVVDAFVEGLSKQGISTGFQ